MLISGAEALTSSPLSSRPPSTLSWDAIFTTWLPPTVPRVILPKLSCVTTLLLADWPTVIPWRGANSPPVIVFPEIVKLLFIDKLFKPEISLLLSSTNALFAKALPLVIPPTLLISEAVEVTPDKIFNSSPDATISVAPSLREEVVNLLETEASPDIAKDPLANVISAVSSLWPIVLLPTTTLAVLTSPPDIAPVVVIVSSPILIEPNPEVIEPASRAPTVTKSVLPSLAE